MKEVKVTVTITNDDGSQAVVHEKTARGVIGATTVEDSKIIFASGNREKKVDIFEIGMIGMKDVALMIVGIIKNVRRDFNPADRRRFDAELERIMKESSRTENVPTEVAKKGN